MLERRPGWRAMNGAAWMTLAATLLAPRVLVADPIALPPEPSPAPPPTGAPLAQPAQPALPEPATGAPSLDRPAPVEPIPTRPSLQAIRATESPRLDGSLDDPAWQAAPVTDAFTQKFPNEGQRPSERTLMRVVHDDDAIYVAFDCEQARTPLVARLARRDRKIGADRVEVAISDGARTFEFWVNAAGVLGDGIRFNDTDYSADWDGVWDAQVRQRADGWSAELRIPLLIFRLEGNDGQPWGLQARRYLTVRQETVEWAYIPPTVAGEISHYGRLTGLSGLRRGSPLELRPFVLARGSRDTAGENDLGATAGLDARWHVSSNVNLDLAVNPDFAQVEADEQVLNLTNVETFFPEKRPFFLDGMDMFQLPRMGYFPTSQTLFYTRRIGAVPGEPAVLGGAPESERVLTAAEPATIYGAAKLRGNLGRVSGSLLSAFTGQRDVEVERADGTRRDALAAPPSWFNVARVRASLGDRTQVGLFATATRRFEPTGDYPRMTPDGSPEMQLCPGGELLAAGDRCFHDSYVASADGYWRSGSGAYVVSGQGIVSAIQGGPPRTMLDGTVISSGDADAGGTLFAAKEGGNWLGSVEVEALGRRLDFNDLGFMPRQNHLRLLPTLEYKAVEPFGGVAETRARVSTSFRNTVDGLNLFRGYFAFTEWRLKSSWKASTMVYYYGRRFDDREVGDGTAVERTSGVGFDVYLESDPGRRVSGSLSTETVFRRDGHEFAGSGQLDFHVLPQLELQLLPRVTFTRGEVRYLEAGAQPNEYLFGRLDARSVGATLRANYTLTPRLTLQLFTQALLVARRYDDFTTFLASQPRTAIRLSELTPAAAPADNPDGELATLDVNAVLRWEFRPGSTMFLVYTRSQAPARVLEMGERAGLDLGALRDGPAANALLLKISYWWN